MSCAPLFLSACVWVCRIRNTEGGERMNMWRGCAVVPPPFLFFFLLVLLISLLSFAPGQSVCLAQFVCPHMHLLFCCLSLPFVSICPLSSCDVAGYHWTRLSLILNIQNIICTIIKENQPGLDVNFLILFLFPFVCHFIIPYDLCL